MGLHRSYAISCWMTCSGENDTMDIREFYDYCKEIANYTSAVALVEWDMRTKMPPKAAPDRSMVAGKLGRTVFVEYFKRPAIDWQLSEVGWRNVELVTKQYRKISAITPD